MKMSSILLLLVVGLLPACRTAYSFSIYNPPPEEWVRTSDVIVTAKPRAAVRQGERCVAQFTVEEVLKGRFSETILTVPMYVEIKEKPCSGITIISGIENRIDWNKDIGSTYLLFLRRINGGFDFPGFYNVSSLAMIENIERLIAIEAADNA
ncbi:MAG: hypothetical protein FWF13_04600, partial [Acidobacteria bacterium]|nr:hypothetical protein [Acidobacteriota bacterium]